MTKKLTNKLRTNQAGECIVFRAWNDIEAKIALCYMHMRPARDFLLLYTVQPCLFGLVFQVLSASRWRAVSSLNKLKCELSRILLGYFRLTVNVSIFELLSNSRPYQL